MGADFTHAELALGLHELADFIAAHDDMPLPYLPSIRVYDHHYGDGAAVAEAARVAQLLGRCDKRVTEDANTFDLVRRFGPVELVVQFRRNSVCERREVTRTVVEWVCPPSLIQAAADLETASREAVEA